MNRLRLYQMFMTILLAICANAQVTPVSQMEKLNRGVVALTASTGRGNFVSWRFLGTDDESKTRFDLLRDETTIAKDLYETNYVDNSGSNTSSYRVVTKVDGEPIDTSATVTAWGAPCKILTLDRPAKGTQGGTYSPNDCSVGDVDGDGEYELFVKWDPSNAQDNANGGVTDNTIIDCYKLDGTKLWRIDLGCNIRSGAHYTQYMVYDFDGDGKAEMICKTAPGSIDGTGQYVNQAATDEKIKTASNSKSWVVDGGRINGGHEYLTVFEGETGRAIHTIAYFPNRNAKTELSEATGSFNWDDRSGKNDKGDYGNRGERYLAAVAYLGGQDEKPSGIFCRGYYTYAYVWAVDFDGKQLKHRWLHRSDSKTQYSVVDADMKESAKITAPKATSGSGSNTMYSNGNHNMSVADVDGDGRDEIIWGSAALDDDGTLLYATGYGHGDAIHLADHCPDRPGLEMFEIHEEVGETSWDLHDATTGEILLKGKKPTKDNGRGIAGQFDANTRGSLLWSSQDNVARSAVTGNQVSTKIGSSNFRIYWDADLQDELLDGNKIDKWHSSGTTSVKSLSGGPNLACNGTKNTPNLQADIFGDWREEVILHNGADKIAIYSSNIETGYRIPTLMHDHMYRMGIAWQNTAYNQPPHLGYYLPDALLPPHLLDKEFTVMQGEPFEFSTESRYIKTVLIKSSITPDGTTNNSTTPDGMTYSFGSTNKTFTLNGTASQAGDYQIILTLSPYSGTNITDTVVIHSQSNPAGIETIEAQSQADQPAQIYDMKGQRHTETRPGGIYIIRRGDKTVKVTK